MKLSEKFYDRLLVVAVITFLICLGVGALFYCGCFGADLDFVGVLIYAFGFYLAFPMLIVSSCHGL